MGSKLAHFLGEKKSRVRNLYQTLCVFFIAYLVFICPDNEFMVLLCSYVLLWFPFLNNLIQLTAYCAILIIMSGLKH